MNTPNYNYYDQRLKEEDKSLLEFFLDTKERMLNKARKSKLVREKQESYKKKPSYSYQKK